jgi:hypothetical protein
MALAASALPISAISGSLLNGVTGKSLTQCKHVTVKLQLQAKLEY